MRWVLVHSPSRASQPAAADTAYGIALRLGGSRPRARAVGRQSVPARAQYSVSLKRSPPASFKRLLGDTRSRTPPPTACHPHTQKQTDTGQPTDQNRCYGGVEIRHGDRGGDRESGNPANERATAILLRATAAW